MSNEIKPVKVRDLPRFLKACEPIADALLAGNVKSAIMGNIEAIIEATAIGAGVEPEWLNEQELDVLVDLASKVVEVNVDFFVQTLLPQIKATSERIEKKTEGLGTTAG